MVRVARLSVRIASFLALLTVFASWSTDATARPGAPRGGRPKPWGTKGGGGKAGGGHGRHHRGPRLKPAAPLAVLPTLSRIELTVDSAFLIVTETLQLAQNEWEKGDLRLCVGHGAPGAPKAFEARLLPPPPQLGNANTNVFSTILPTEFAPFCPVNARVVLGGPHMATSVITISESQLRAAFDKSDRATIQTRLLIESPRQESDGAREVLLRLGAPEESPITLASIAIASRAEKLGITRAEATLCGPQADAIPLAVEGAPRSRPTLEPVLVIRRPSDELCIRYWTDTR